MITLLSGFLSDVIFTDTGTDWRGSDHVYKKPEEKGRGSDLCSFAILMYGMNAMSGAVEPLAEVPEFTGMLVKFSNPILGVVAGAVLTAIIQSSSASVGILQALCLTGMVPFSAALPIIMGQNIGTCITAILSAIGASKNAKRAAMVHLYFNLIGTMLFMAVFYAINAAVHFSFMAQAATPAGIAILHSAFNITATLVLLPFGKALEKLACLTIRDRKEEEEKVAADPDFMILESRFLEKPAFAVEQSRNAAKKNGRGFSQNSVYRPGPSEEFQRRRKGSGGRSREKGRPL